MQTMAKIKVAKNALGMARGFSNSSTSASQSPPQSLSPKPMSSNPSSQNDTTGLHSLDNSHERLVKSLIKSFKRLEKALGKFDGKPAGITKTNILRTVMLPFLRSSPPLHSFFEKGTTLYSSFASISTTVLGLWWRSLVTCLNATGSSQVSTSDRSAYLECVSRIMALEEWHNADAQAVSTFTACLCDTLDHSISRLLSSKVVSISISAFVGKVFAYSFFYLPGVCSALLFLLNVKQKTLDKSSSALSSVTTASKEKAQAIFPPFVTHLIDYKGLEKLDREKRAAINCVIPPKHPVRGIRDPSGPWVRRWCSTDSDVFNSFFRHYMNVTDSILRGNSSVPPESFPGMRVVTSYIYQTISVSVNRISLSKAAGNVGGSTKPSNGASPQGSPKHKEATNGSNLPPSSIPFKQIDCNYTSIIKMFRSIRDIGYSSIPFASQITTIVDSLLASAARQIGLYDVNRTSLLLNLVYEFSIHVFDAADIDWVFWLHCNYLMLTSTYHVQIVTKNIAFLFNVWNRIPDLLVRRETTPQYSWLRDLHESPKTNFSNWLTSSSMWQTYFMHWNPLVRSHYQRLLVWRIIGVNNYETPTSMHTTRRIKRNANLTFESLCEALASDENTGNLANLDFSSDSPIVNRKFGIVPINGKSPYSEEVSSLMSATTMYKSSDLRKSHPYEILDEAIYTCTSLHNSPGLSHSGSSDSISQQKFTESNSIIDSLSRFFKILSTEESTEKDTLTMAPPKKISGRIEIGSPLRARTLSKSMLSLSAALSMKSVPSNQSLASSQSSPESLNDQSTESSITSDSDSSFSDRGGSSSISTLSSHSSPNLQPPELIKIPPDIVRPVSKLEIIIDHELNSSKYQQMQDHKKLSKTNLFFGSQTKHNSSYQTLPKPPKTPSVSVFLNSDAFHKFYITKETYSLGEDVMTKDEVDDFNSFKHDLSEKVGSKSDLAVLGKTLNEWNMMVDEFENYLFEKVEADQTNYLPIASIDDEVGVVPPDLINEVDYFTRIIPLFPIDNFTEMKLLNAS